ncbi:uncharacterized protein [Physcomitrium patens]|uniref:uncharacterized protein isoform X2 n=1 Tax=Physcomitrium patens TaxID=3218 RepID=UPI000D15AE47|nr:uncharacterized protein LOC112273226 isoform X2 [Physcomitrium patens]|eukprot:XP_024357480.1 uncharacterized protein LOC112273226 isoform X2 [Physcomitrella patens]
MLEFVALLRSCFSDMPWDASKPSSTAEHKRKSMNSQCWFARLMFAGCALPQRKLLKSREYAPWSKIMTIVVPLLLRYHQSVLYSLDSSTGDAGLSWTSSICQNFQNQKNLHTNSMQVYPIVLVIGTAVGLCGTAIVRNASINPDVRINKEDRAAGYLENFTEGKAYKDSAHRRFFAKQSRMVTTRINEAFGGAKKQ